MTTNAIKLLAAAVAGTALAVPIMLWLDSRKPDLPPAPSQARPVMPPEVASPPVVAPPVRLHNYDVQDGPEYGYTAAITPQEQQAGQVGNSVFMFSYAGQRDEKYQVHLAKGNVLQAFECSAPCEVIKIMTVIDEDGLRQHVNTERMRVAPNMIAALALEDAINGKLRAYEQHRNGRRYEVWVDDAKGLRRKDIGVAKADSK